MTTMDVAVTPASIEAVGNGEKTQKKQQKPRRNFPKMNEEPERSQLNEINIKQKELSNQLKELNVNITNLNEKKKTLIKNRDEIRVVFRGLCDEKNKVIETLKGLNQKIKSYRSLADQKKKDIFQARSKLQIKKGKNEEEIVKLNQEYYEKEVIRLETRLEQETLSLSEEKKIMKDIEKTKQEKNVVIKAYETKVKEILNGLPPSSELQAQRKAQEEVLGGLKEKTNAQFTLLKAAEGKVDVEQKKVKELIVQCNKLRDQRTALSQEYTAVKAKLDERYKKWREEQKIQEQKRKERQARLYQERQAYRKQKEEERKAEEDAMIPFIDEIMKCEQLTAYLQRLKPSQSTENKDNSNNNSGGRRNRNRRRKNNAKLRLDVATHIVFQALSLTPPTHVSGVEESIKQVEEKLAEYKQKSEEKIAERKAKREADEKAKEEAEKAKEEAAKSEEASTDKQEETKEEGEEKEQVGEDEAEEGAKEGAKEEEGEVSEETEEKAKDSEVVAEEASTPATTAAAAEDELEEGEIRE